MSNINCIDFTLELQNADFPRLAGGLEEARTLKSFRRIQHQLGFS